MSELEGIPEPTKGAGDGYISTRSDDYNNTVTIANAYFYQLGYSVTHGHLWRDEKKRTKAIANIYLKPRDPQGIPLALLIAFPKKQQNSTRRLLIRLTKLAKCTDSLGVILGYSTRGTGTFPYVSKRIWEKYSLARIFVLDLKTASIKQILNQEI